MCISHQAFDVVLTVKEFMHSATPSQNRILVMPHRVAMELFANSDKLKLHPHTVFSEEQLRDYKATAKVVSKAPWELLKAQVYLENLCQA